MEGQGFLVSLRPFDEGAEVRLSAGSFTIGRSMFGIKDKYCSRKQAVIDVEENGELSLTAQGTNPMQLKRKGETEFKEVPNAVRTPIQDGDIFTLYHKRHPICVIVPKPVKSMEDIIPGVCVWFKHPGYPYWPARIAKETEIGPGVKKKKGDNTHLIYFFGTHDYLWVQLPNEIIQAGDEKKRRRQIKPSHDPDRSLDCRCFSFVASVAEMEDLSRKRKRSPVEQYPIHLYYCREIERKKGSESDEFLRACEEANQWILNPEERQFKVFNPEVDSDDDESAEVPPPKPLPPPKTKKGSTPKGVKRRKIQKEDGEIVHDQSGDSLILNDGVKAEEPEPMEVSAPDTVVAAASEEIKENGSEKSADVKMEAAEEHPQMDVISSEASDEKKPVVEEASEVKAEEPSKVEAPVEDKEDTAILDSKVIEGESAASTSAPVESSDLPAPVASESAAEPKSETLDS